MLKKIDFKRKLLSLSIILLAYFLYSLSRAEAIICMLVLSMIFTILDLIYHKTGTKNFLMRLYFNLYPKKEHEYERSLSDATVFFWSTFLMVILFSREIMMYSIAVYIIADATAHIFGIIFHGGELFWNKEKTWGGLVPSFLFALLTGYLVIKLIPEIDFSAFKIAASAGIIALMGTLNDYDNVAMPWGAAIFLRML